jgi:quercetin dioxygenase-like cupin family protein
MSEGNYNDLVLRLVEVFRGLLAQRAQVLDETGQEAAHVHSLLRELPPLSGGFSPSPHPITGSISKALGAGNEATAALIEAIRPLAINLPWRYSYAERPDAPGLAEKVAFAEVVGPEAPYLSQQLCFGLTLIAPGSFYPPHRHPAVELYFVAAGTADWTADEITCTQAPGSFVLHPSQVIHAMQTTGSPLLAIYTWSGEDIVSPSIYV